MPAVTVLRGFKVSISTLDAFLLANGVDATYGTPPFYEDHPDSDPVSKLLFSKMGEAGDKNDYRLIIPQCEGHSPADTAYITYVWFMVYAQRELRDSDLPSEIPPAFNGLRDDVVSFSENPHNQIDGQMGRYVVFTQERNYMPEEMYQQNLIVSLNTPPHLPFRQSFTSYRGISNATSVIKNGSIHRGHGRHGRHTVCAYTASMNVPIHSRKLRWNRVTILAT